eukprot:7388932-Prymnesium_polylepis.1
MPQQACETIKPRHNMRAHRMAAATISDAASNIMFDPHATKHRLLTSVRARPNETSSSMQQATP